MYDVLVTVPTIFAEEGKKAKELLESHNCNLIQFSYRQRPIDEFYSLVARADAAIVGSEPWDEKALSHAVKLKIIARHGVGFDAVDLKKTRELNIDVANTRLTELSNGVAELALGLIISVYRNIPRHDAIMKGRKWESIKGRLVNGKTVGLVGFGAIAQALARMLSGLEVNILAYDKYPNHSKADELRVKLVSFEELLRESDIVSLHVPSMAETRHLMNDSTIGMMKKSAILINTARGALIDEAALYRCLSCGVISAAAIDVFEKEPTPADNPLLGLDNLICLPHVAGNGIETLAAIAYRAAQNVVDRLEGRPLDCIVNL